MKAPARQRGAGLLGRSRRLRALTLAVSTRVGTLQRWTGAWAPAAVLAGAAAVLATAPVSLASGLAVIVVMAVVVLLAAPGRRKVIVEQFVDYTQEDAKTVSGLGTLLITELDRLQREVDTNDEIPAAVGIERLGGFGRGKECQQEAARFLTASSDGLTQWLKGAVSSDATVGLGPLKVPIGPILAVLSALSRGPHLASSVHRIAASGRLVVTAQLVGGPVAGSWKVQAPAEDDVPGRPPVLDAMVRELAYRMFTDTSFEASGRWRAVEAFAEYLRLYRESDRADTLKRAEAKLLEALAEDESFGLAYYNLGVIYTRLALAGGTAEPASQLLTRPHELDREALAVARRNAARVAFWTATQKAPELWQAHYALAVTQFAAIPAIEIDASIRDRRRESLEQVIRGCKQALVRCSGDAPGSAAVIHDLIGMAEVRLADGSSNRDCFAAGIRAHRAAVGLCWQELCRAARLARARDSALDGRVQQARDNAAASLHNLALAYARRAMLTPTDAARDYAVADRIFSAAIRVAGVLPERASASWFERGFALEDMGRLLERRGHVSRAARALRRAADAYGRSADLTPTHAEYAACQTRALAARAAVLIAADPEWAGRGEALATVDASARRALRELAPILRDAVAPLAPTKPSDRCERTLAAVESAWEMLHDDGGVWRVQQLRTLGEQLRNAGRTPLSVGPDSARQKAELRRGINRLQRLRDEWAPTLGPVGGVHHAEHANMINDQIEMALARLLAAAGEWERAQQTLAALIARLQARGRPDCERIVDFGLRAEYARALRHTRRGQDALREIGECVRANPLAIDAHREAARIHYSLGRYDDALSSWEAALKLAPNDAYAHFKAAICHRQVAACHHGAGTTDRASALDRAAKHLDRALVLFDNEDTRGAAWARVWSGRVALERGRIGDSIAWLEGALDGPARIAALLFLGEARLEAGALDVAEETLIQCDAAIHGGHPDADDVDWGYQLPRELIACRVHCGLARCHLARSVPSGRQVEVEFMLARAQARRVPDPHLRCECELLLAENAGQLTPGVHVELSERLTQVPFNRLLGDKQRLRDLSIAHP